MSQILFYSVSTEYSHDLITDAKLSQEKWMIGLLTTIEAQQRWEENQVPLGVPFVLAR
jgi:hypothetical protein